VADAVLVDGDGRHDDVEALGVESRQQSLKRQVQLLDLHVGDGFQHVGHQVGVIADDLAVVDILERRVTGLRRDGDFLVRLDARQQIVGLRPARRSGDECERTEQRDDQTAKRLVHDASL